MLFNRETMKKLPMAWQAVFCFALIVMGVMIAAVWAETLSKAGEIGLWIAYMLIAGLYLIAGLPGFIEAVMTMNAEVETRKVQEAQTKITTPEKKG